jgi:hypothetical protein
MTTGDKVTKARKTKRKDASQTQPKRGPKAKTNASGGATPPKARARKSGAKEATAAKKRKHEGEDAPVVESQEVVATNSNAQPKAPEEKIVIDDGKLVGQYTRARRFAMQTLEKFGDGLIPRNGRLDTAADPPKGGKFVPANQLRFSKGGIQLTRWIAQNLCLLTFEKLAVLLKLTGRQTLCHDTVHALRFIMYGGDNTIAAVNRRPMQQLCTDVVHDYTSGKLQDRMGDKDWQNVTRSLSFVGAEKSEDYRELLGDDMFSLNDRPAKPASKKQKQLAN